eukprot:scaffold164953_cov19-Prasinocladus_malaysianus.AAC.1
MPVTIRGGGYIHTSAHPPQIEPTSAYSSGLVTAYAKSISIHQLFADHEFSWTSRPPMPRCVQTNVLSLLNAIT